MLTGLNWPDVPEMTQLFLPNTPPPSLSLSALIPGVEEKEEVTFDPAHNRIPACKMSGHSRDAQSLFVGLSE